MRKRILIGLLPLLVLLVAIGCYAIALFFRLGGAIDTILRENYASVVACQNMKESAERMDSALFFTLAGQWDYPGRCMTRIFRSSTKTWTRNSITSPSRREGSWPTRCATFTGSMSRR